MNNAAVSIAVTATYLVLLLAIGYLSYRRTDSTAEDYFMGSRSFGTFVLAMSIFATNMTGVYIIGTPGFAYRSGIGVFGYMAVSAIVIVGYLNATIGLRCWMLGKAYGYITPGEMFSERLESGAVNIVYIVFFTVFTTAYLVTAVIGAGIALEALTEGTIGYSTGCLLILSVTLAYTSLGGMRGTAWTNVLQGSIFLSITLVAFFVIALKNGGFAALTQQVMTQVPELFQREGLISWKRYLSWALICPVAAIAYPHVLMRIMTAKTSHGVRNYTWLYGVLIFVGFIPVIYIGLWGRVLLPGLEGQMTDNILPLMMGKYMAGGLAGLALAGILAAAMSSIDAMLLTLSTLFTRDILARYTRLDPRRQAAWGRSLCVAVGAAAYVAAIYRPGTIYAVAGMAMSGFALMVPSYAAALYWRRTTAAGVVASLAVSGVLMAVFYATDWLVRIQFGFMPIVPLLAVNVFVLVGVSLATPRPSRQAVEKWFGMFDVFYRRNRKQIRSILDQVDGRRDILEGNWIITERVKHEF